MAEIVGNAGLTGIVLIDIAIGIIFAVLTFALVASALHEAIAGVLNYRGEHLRKGIARMINQANVTRELLSHPLVKSLKGPKNLFQKVLSVLFMWGDAARDKDRMPSAIPKSTFARALVESLVNRREDLTQTVGATAESVMSSLGQEIDQLALDRRLKARLHAVVSRIDFDRVEQGLGERVDAAVGKAEALVDALGVEIDQLGLDDVLAERVKAEIGALDLSGRAEELIAQVTGVVDNIDLEETLRQGVRDTLSRIDFTAIESKVSDTLDRVSARAEAALEEAVAEVEEELAEWFDSAMDRVTGWYVRRAKTMLFVIGFVMAAALNFDVIGYGKQLASDDALRSAMVQRAAAAVASGQVGAFTLNAPQVEELAAAGNAKDSADRTELEKSAIRAMVLYNRDGEPGLSEADIDQAEKELRAAFALVAQRGNKAIAAVTTEFEDQGVTLGASFWQAEPLIMARMVLSWLLIGLGCTLGGQFWFDLLKSLLKVRAGASGLNSDLERLARSRTGKA